MSDIKLTLRNHDSEWLLHLQKVTNDNETRSRQRAAARGKRAVTRFGKNTTPPILQNVPELTAAEIDTARTVLAGAVSNLAGISHDLKIVLDTLGLLPDTTLATETTPLGERRRAHGRCPECQRPSIGLGGNRELLPHTPLTDENICPGTGRTVPKPQPAPVAALKARREKTRQAARSSVAALADLTRPACKDEDPELFFGPDGERQPERDLREEKAKAVCARCRLVDPCLTYALDNARKHGVWGGTTPDQRKSMTRRKQRYALLAERTTA